MSLETVLLHHQVVVIRFHWFLPAIVWSGKVSNFNCFWQIGTCLLVTGYGADILEVLVNSCRRAIMLLIVPFSPLKRTKQLLSMPAPEISSPCHLNKISLGNSCFVSSHSSNYCFNSYIKRSVLSLVLEMCKCVFQSLSKWESWSHVMWKCYLYCCVSSYLKLHGDQVLA